MYRFKKINNFIDVKIDTEFWSLPLAIDNCYNLAYRNRHELRIYVLCFGIRFILK